MKVAKQFLEEFEPEVVLASTMQLKGTGLSLCTRLRRYPGGDCLMVVHGSSPEGADVYELRAGLGTKYKVDHWLNNNASPALVALTIKQLLRGHLGTRPRSNRRPMMGPASLTNSAVAAPSVSETRSGRQASLARLRSSGNLEVEFRRPGSSKSDA
jgi:DNA-binding response OmpR family regulator